jgi:hypothetical protein
MEDLPLLAPEREDQMPPLGTVESHAPSPLPETIHDAESVPAVANLPSPLPETPNPSLPAGSPSTPVASVPAPLPAPLLPPGSPLDTPPAPSLPSNGPSPPSSELPTLPAADTHDPPPLPALPVREARTEGMPPLPFPATAEASPLPSLPTSTREEGRGYLPQATPPEEADPDTDAMQQLQEVASGIRQLLARPQGKESPSSYPTAPRNLLSEYGLHRDF